MTRFGSRSAQSFKPPTPSTAPSTQHPALPAHTLDIVLDDDNQPRVFATDDNQPKPFPLLHLQSWKRHRPQPRPHHPCLVICVQSQALRLQRFLIDLSIWSRPRNASRPSRNSWLVLRCPRYASYYTPPTSESADASIFSKPRNPIPLCLGACPSVRGSPTSRRLYPHCMRLLIPPRSRRAAYSHPARTFGIRFIQGYP